MLSFLLKHYKKHKISLTSVSGLALAIAGVIWTYDLPKLTPTGTLTPITQLEIRIFLTLILSSLYLLSLLIITLYHYKKDTEPDMAQRLLESRKMADKLQISFQPQETVGESDEPFFQSNLYWLPNDENAYCPSCFGKDKKLVPMVTYTYHVSESSDIDRFRCATFPTCKFHTDIVPHPKYKK